MSPNIGGTEVTIAITVIKTLVLIVGSIITYFAFKAYRRTRQSALGYLAAGFGIVTLGLVLAGTGYELLGVGFEVGILIESLLVLVGFCIIAYSLYVQ
jgi:heme/copper-type cytochrome/quinol oxidase subunit 3